jgi:hypothetical protein
VVNALAIAIKKPFYSEGDEKLVVNSGSLIDSMPFYLRAESYADSASIVAFGYLRQNGTQLVAEIAPDCGSNLFIQVRQDTKDGNTVDVYFVTKQYGELKILKDYPWHQQPANTSQFYNTNFEAYGNDVLVCIGSQLKWEDFMEKIDSPSREQVGRVYFRRREALGRV